MPRGGRPSFPNITTVTLQPGEWLRGLDTSGGGYGDPLERSPELVRHDVMERWETPERARDIYGVVLMPVASTGDLVVDLAATEARRSELKRRRTPSAAGGKPMEKTR